MLYELLVFLKGLGLGLCTTEDICLLKELKSKRMQKEKKIVHYKPKFQDILHSKLRHTRVTFMTVEEKTLGS